MYWVLDCCILNLFLKSKIFFGMYLKRIHQTYSAVKPFTKKWVWETFHHNIGCSNYSDIKKIWKSVIPSCDRDQNVSVQWLCQLKLNGCLNARPWVFLRLNYKVTSWIYKVNFNWHTFLSKKAVIYNIIQDKILNTVKTKILLRCW